MGATHMTMARILNTSRWMYSMPRRIGSPWRPIACRANPASSATSSVCRTSPSVNADTSVLGMIPSRKSEPLFAPPAVSALCLATACTPSPGSIRLPTTRPISSAISDMIVK